MGPGTDTPTKSSPPYFAFKTLINILDQMKEKGVPNRVDRTFLVGMSGAGQTQFIHGLKGLALIDGQGKVQPRLTELAQASPGRRKQLLGEIVREVYPKAVELGATNATTGELVELFREEYGFQGDTARKGIAFFLNVARYADVPVSPMFQTPRVSTGTRKRKKTGTANGTTDNTDSHEGEQEGDTPPVPPVGIVIPEFHPTLAGVLSEFPRRGRGWTEDRRNTVMKMFEAAVDFTIPITGEEFDEEEEFEEVTEDDLQR